MSSRILIKLIIVFVFFSCLFSLVHEFLMVFYLKETSLWYGIISVITMIGMNLLALKLIMDNSHDDKTYFFNLIVGIVAIIIIFIVLVLNFLFNFLKIS